MYSDPFVVFREYIQNCVDSIDQAINEGILNSDASDINICLSPSDRTIKIRDNGKGLSVEEAEKALISIGNSKKSSESSRGFRGIGRLAALSYCKRLTFTTSTCGEAKGTKITIDAEKLAELLSTNNSMDATIVDVLESVYHVNHFQEKEFSHYFIVLLEGVDESSSLNSYDDVLDYLTQNVPVPYDPDTFVWGKEIVGRLQKEGYQLNSYNISLTYGSSSIRVYKSYKDKFVVDKGKNIVDSIKDIEIIRILNANGTLSAIGWIGATHYLGSIYDKSIKGIRLRKGNILVGDYQTMNVAFKDARFNGWSVGEIFAIDTSLIPNARRDNYEKNAAYFNLLEQLTDVAARITKDIRVASLNRNADLSKALEQSGKIKKVAEAAIDSGISSFQKGAIKQKLVSAQEALTNIKTEESSDTYYQTIAFEELDMLIGKLKGATTYKALNTIDKLTNMEKKILEKVFNVIMSLNVDNAENIIEAILVSFIS
jgi:molecular chaperone HtpG